MGGVSTHQSKDTSSSDSSDSKSEGADPHEDMQPSKKAKTDDHNVASASSRQEGNSVINIEEDEVRHDE